jgi:hypothetical protein
LGDAEAGFSRKTSSHIGGVDFGEPHRRGCPVSLDGPEVVWVRFELHSHSNANLASENSILESHIAKAVHYRSMDRRLFG